MGYDQYKRSNVMLVFFMLCPDLQVGPSGAWEGVLHSAEGCWESDPHPSDVDGLFYNNKINGKIRAGSPPSRGPTWAATMVTHTLLSLVSQYGWTVLRMDGDGWGRRGITLLLYFHI